MTHRYVSKLAIIGSDNALSLDKRLAIKRTDAGILLIVHLGTNFSETLIEIYTFSVGKMQFRMSSAKWWPFCQGLNVFLLCLFRYSTCTYHLIPIISIFTHEST